MRNRIGVPFLSCLLAAAVFLAWTHAESSLQAQPPKGKDAAKPGDKAGAKPGEKPGEKPGSKADMKDRDDTREPINCDTGDGVKLVGDLYPAGKAKDARSPTVILLHAVGPNHSGASRRDFGKFPERLAAEGFNVVTFDFRGHGDSKIVDPARYFTVYPYTGKGRPTAKIDAKEFRDPRQYALMVNDLIAIKVWLNKMNNDRRLSSTNVALVGVEQGAAVGMLWLVNEFRDPNRPKEFSETRIGPPRKFEGEDVAAVVWISMNGMLGNIRLDVISCESWLTLLRERSVNTYAIFGETDVASKTFWDRALKWIKPERDKDLYKLTGTKRIKNTKLTGTKLLDNETFGVQKNIIDYLEDALMKSGRQWQMHNGNTTATIANLRTIGL